MYKNKRILGFIPARGGSQQLKNKNILPFAGKPLIAWTIEAAKQSSFIDSVLVSTDSPQIAETSTAFGAYIPFLRPAELATGDSLVIDAIEHTLEQLHASNDDYDIVIMLQPTSPLRQAADIDNAITTLFSSDFKAIVSVCETDHSPLWSNVLPEDKCMKNFLRPDVRLKNRQELPIYYRLNGAIYAADLTYLRENRSFIGDQTLAFIMSRQHSIDIDTELDFRIAEFLAVPAPDLPR